MNIYAYIKHILVYYTKCMYIVNDYLRHMPIMGFVEYVRVGKKTVTY